MEDNFSKVLADSMRIQGLAILLSSPAAPSLPNSVKKRILYALIAGVKLTKEELEEIEKWFAPHGIREARQVVQQSKHILFPPDPSSEEP